MPSTGPRTKILRTLSCMSCPFTHRSFIEKESRAAADRHYHEHGHVCALEESVIDLHRPRLRRRSPTQEQYADRETQHGRYLDCGPAAWDDR